MSIATRILKNTLSNWAGMLINTIILVLLTPYLLRNLGNERYGIYQIVVPVIQYLILLELGLRGSVSRFASKYIAAKDIKSLNSVVSTTFFIFLAIGLIIMLISVVLGFLSPHFFSISKQYEQGALYVFAALGFNSVVSFLSYSFGGVLVGRQRYDLINLRLIINNACNALLVVLFFSAGWATLASWALAIVVSASLGLLYLVAIAFRIQEGLSIRLRHVRLATFKELIGFSLWNMLIQLAGSFILYTNPLIIGRYMGLQMVPYYSIPFMLIVRLQDGVTGLSGTLIPLASSTLATGDTELMRRLLRKGTYVASMLVFPLGGVLLVMCKNLFRVWLPEGYENSWVIYGILMISFFGSISQSVSFFLMLGGGNIRPIAVFYLVSGITTVALSIYLVGYTNLGLIGAALAIVIPRLISTNLFLPWYACRQVGLNLWRYIIGSYTRPILCSLPSVALGALLVYYLPPSNLFGWVMEYFIALIPFVVFALTGVLDWPLREKIVARLIKFLRLNKLVFIRAKV